MTETHVCPNDQTPLLPAKLRQVKLVLQLEAAGFFESAGSTLTPYTCPTCGLTRLYAEPPLRPATS
jgi:hypothetical protein